MYKIAEIIVHAFHRHHQLNYVTIPAQAHPCKKYVKHTNSDLHLIDIRFCTSDLITNNFLLFL